MKKIRYINIKLFVIGIIFTGILLSQNRDDNCEEYNETECLLNSNICIWSLEEGCIEIDEDHEDECETDSECDMGYECIFGDCEEIDEDSDDEDCETDLDCINEEACIDGECEDDWDDFCEDFTNEEDCIENFGCNWEYDDDSEECEAEENITQYFLLLNGFYFEYMQYLMGATVTDSIIGYVTIESSEDLDFGDNIGLLDYNGVGNYNDCSVGYEPVVVGAGEWLGTPLTIPIYSSIDNCDEDGTNLPGFVNNNLIYIYAWDDSGNNVRRLIVNDRPDLYFNSGAINISEVYFAVDPNEDGVFDVLDITLMVDIILGGDSNNNNLADINLDGNLDIMDVIFVVNLILE